MNVAGGSLCGNENLPQRGRRGSERGCAITTNTAHRARKARKALLQAVELAREAHDSPGVQESVRRRSRNCPRSRNHSLGLSGPPHRKWPRFLLPTLAVTVLPYLLALAGCGGVSANSPGGNGSSSNGTFSISPGAATFDTNCTGCNATNSSGSTIEQFSATLNSGSPADVTWSLPSGGTYGSITPSGQYTPPGYLTADSLKVTVTAKLASNPSIAASATVTVTPGFLQPLTPENAAVAGGGTATITAYIAEAGGTTGVNYTLSNTDTGSSGGQGSLGTPNCVRNASAGAFTYCTVTYTAPSSVSSTSDTYVVATVGGSSSKETAMVLLNAAGVDSNPANHQQQLSTPIALGSSGGNNSDYDTQGSQITDCCSGTLGSLIQNASGTQYLLSNNHVLARSDQASVGEMIIQPGLIDNNCSPYGNGGTEIPVGTLTVWVPIDSSATDVDAAIAQVESGSVNSSGAILELGARQSNGTLAAEPPGVSSTGGKGETASLNMTVAKSGRTTGLTCASISTLAVDVKVSYYTDCAETKPYYTKSYTNQIGITGNQFSDAGDSGSLVVDTSDAEPVGLFFAGGVDQSGQSQGVANPAPEVLSELATQVGNGAAYTFVGTKDHPVSCLNYGDGTAVAAQARTLSGAEIDHAQQALMQARALVNPSTGILGVATGKSSDHAGEAAVIVYVDPNMSVAVPATVNGVRTVVIPASPQAVAAGTAPTSVLGLGALPALPAAVLNQAIAVKQQVAQNLMRQNPAFFGVGVGQSLDDPKEAALVIYVDRNQVPTTLPAAIDGLRTRYVIMERLHVTRAYARGVQRRSRCMPRPASGPAADLNLLAPGKPRDANLF